MFDFSREYHVNITCVAYCKFAANLQFSNALFCVVITLFIFFIFYFRYGNLMWYLSDFLSKDDAFNCLLQPYESNK